MTSERSTNEAFLSRWSRRKREAAREPIAQAFPSVTDASAVGTPVALVNGPSAATAVSRAKEPVSVDDHLPAHVPSLPPVDSLTIDSDFAQFLQPRVPESLRRAAVKKLFADPHFNVMDGLDTYIDDYSKPDPLPEGWLEKLTHARDLIDHPSNRKAEEAQDAAQDPGLVAEDLKKRETPPCLPDDVAADSTSDSVKQVDWVERVERVERVESVESVERVELVERVEPMERVEPVERVEPMERSETRPASVEISLAELTTQRVLQPRPGALRTDS